MIYIVTWLAIEWPDTERLAASRIGVSDFGLIQIEVVPSSAIFDVDGESEEILLRKSLEML